MYIYIFFLLSALFIYLACALLEHFHCFYLLYFYSHEHRRYIIRIAMGVRCASRNLRNREQSVAMYYHILLRRRLRFVSAFLRHLHVRLARCRSKYFRIINKILLSTFDPQIFYLTRTNFNQFAAYLTYCAFVMMNRRFSAFFFSLDTLPI